MFREHRTAVIECVPDKPIEKAPPQPDPVVEDNREFLWHFEVQGQREFTVDKDNVQVEPGTPCDDARLVHCKMHGVLAARRTLCIASEEHAGWSLFTTTQVQISTAAVALVRVVRSRATTTPADMQHELLGR